ncbi:MAG: P-II family nitrogen regulator [Clostridiales bacterium]|jgi:hypothetical protein|nr:P-II family nitrogen regulator [Clostridiales bacterium]
MDANGYSLILTIVNKGFAVAVMEAARGAGAKGGTIVNGRGTGQIESEKFLGFAIEPEKEIVMILTENAFRHDIMMAVYKNVGLSTDGSGFSFSLPVDEIVGTALITAGSGTTPDAATDK